MKKSVKKTSLVFFIVMMIILSSQVMAKPEIPDSVTVELNNTGILNNINFIVYLIQIVTNTIIILFFIINLIKIIISKMTMNHKFKYFILAFLIMILGFSGVGILSLTRVYADSINGSNSNELAIYIGLGIVILSIILNVILFIRINKRDKINRRIADENNSKKD